MLLPGFEVHQIGLEGRYSHLIHTGGLEERFPCSGHRWCGGGNQA